jgi:hypothetical protein
MCCGAVNRLLTNGKDSLLRAWLGLTLLTLNGLPVAPSMAEAAARLGVQTGMAYAVDSTVRETAYKQQPGDRQRAGSGTGQSGNGGGEQPVKEWRKRGWCLFLFLCYSSLVFWMSKAMYFISEQEGQAKGRHMVRTEHPGEQDQQKGNEPPYHHLSSPP